MCVDCPALAKARVVELRAFYTASGNGADAVAAVTAALAAHATPADATALLLGHAPGWEEAVALLTRHRGGVARLRTAQAALLRSEARGWGDALAAGWEHRGGVALHKAAAKPRVTTETAAAAPPPWKRQPRARADAPVAPAKPRKLSETEALGLWKLDHAQDLLLRSDIDKADASSGEAASKPPAAMSDAELTVALAAAERALPPLPREMSRALALSLNRKKLLPIVPSRERKPDAADASEAAALPAAADGAASFSRFYAQTHDLSAAELAAARAVMDRYLALKPEMLRRLVEKHGDELKEFLQWGWLPNLLADPQRFRTKEADYAGGSTKERELRWTGYVIDGAAIRAARAVRQANSELSAAPGRNGGGGGGTRSVWMGTEDERATCFDDVERWWLGLTAAQRGKLRARLEAARRAAADPQRCATAVAQFWRAEAMAAGKTPPDVNKAAKPAVDSPAPAKPQQQPAAAAADVTVVPKAPKKPEPAKQQAQQQASPPVVERSALASQSSEDAAAFADPPSTAAQSARRARAARAERVYAPYVQPATAGVDGESVAARARREAAEAAAAASWALECVRAAWHGE